MARPGLSDVRRAVTLLPGGIFILSAAFEAKRAGQLVISVHQCAEEPLLICVSARKGHPIEPLIRDSHHFAVSQLSEADRLLMRRFEHPRTPDDRTDPFDALEVDRLVSHAPILRRAILALDCEVVRHIDLEADHELFVGHVRAARVGAA